MSETPQDVVVAMGEFAVGAAPARFVAVGLGSCVALMLHDPSLRVGALAHVALPSPSLARDRDRPARFASTAVPFLLGLLQERGADASRVVARLAGGATMFHGLASRDSMPIGERNVLALRGALRSAGIPIVGEAVGQDFGRSVWFDVTTGEARVRSVWQEEHAI